MKLADRSITRIFKKQIEKACSTDEVMHHGNWDGKVRVLIWRKSTEPDTDYDLVLKNLDLADLDENYVFLGDTGNYAQVMIREDYNTLESSECQIVGHD